MKAEVKDGGPGRTRTFDQWIMSPLLSLCLALKSPINLTHSSTSTLRLFALNGLKGTEMDSS